MSTIQDRAVINEGPFDPAIHLAPLPDKNAIGKIMMSDVGFPDSPLTKVAATHPFPLFTHEAIVRLRGETVKHSTLEKYMNSDNNTPCSIRGHAGPDAPFVLQAWTHPETQRRINDMAGIELEIMFKYEIAHTNIQLGPRGWAALKAEPDLLTNSGDIVQREEIADTQYEEINWHFDSYPFVCICMISESSQIKGGQTVIKNADGTNTLIPMPRIGEAVVVHGGRLWHGVSPTDVTQERMSQITSYRPKDPFADDMSVLRTVRNQSDEQTLHKEWSQYRLEVMAARCLKMAEALEDPTNIESRMEEFQAGLEKFLDVTVKEMTVPVERIRTNTKQSFLDWYAKHKASAAQAPAVST